MGGRQTSRRLNPCPPGAYAWRPPPGWFAVLRTAGVLAARLLPSIAHLVSDRNHPLGALRAPVVFALLPWRQLDGVMGHFAVRDELEKVGDEVEMRGPLVVGLDDVPGRFLDVAAREHAVFRLGVVDPSGAGLQIHGAQLPALAGVVDPPEEPSLLLVIADRKPVLDQDDPGAHEHSLELRTCTHEIFVLGVCAEPHDMLDARAVVPAPIEEHHLAGRWQVLDVTLEIPLRPLFLGRRRERDHPAIAWVEQRHDPFDDTAFAGRIAAFEEDHDAQVSIPDPLLELDELDLEASELPLVLLARELFG